MTQESDSDPQIRKTWRFRSPHQAKTSHRRVRLDESTLGWARWTRSHDTHWSARRNQLSSDPPSTTDTNHPSAELFLHMLWRKTCLMTKSSDNEALEARISRSIFELHESRKDCRRERTKSNLWSCSVNTASNATRAVARTWRKSCRIHLDSDWRAPGKRFTSSRSFCVIKSSSSVSETHTRKHKAIHDIWTTSMSRQAEM